MGRDVFITGDFLLETEPARRLYHEYAEGLPIIDYHCHLPPAQVADDYRFATWPRRGWPAIITSGARCGRTGWPNAFARGMRRTGESSRNGLRRFMSAAQPALSLDPSGAETLLRDIRPPARARHGRGIWEACNDRLARPEYSCRGLMAMSKVVLVCTTDDPADDLAQSPAAGRETARSRFGSCPRGGLIAAWRSRTPRRSTPGGAARCSGDVGR